MNRILIATDGEPWSREAVEHFLATSCIGDAEVTVMTVIPSAEGPLAHEEVARARAVLHAALRDVQASGRAVQGAIRMGNAVDVLAAAVGELGIDLLVLGTRGVGGIAAHQAGGRSVAEALLHEVGCGVLIYPMRGDPRAQAPAHRPDGVTA